MRYAILIYENETTAPHDEAEMRKWGEFTGRLQASGAFLAGEALQPTAVAKTVRRRGERVEITDGSSAKQTEQLTGFYLVECKDLDAALEWAGEIPSAHRGPVEVRPLIELPAT